MGGSFKLSHLTSWVGVGAFVGALPELSKLTWVGGEGGKDHPLLVVGSAQHLQNSPVNSCSSEICLNIIHLVIVKVEVVTDTEPVPTLLAGKTLEMVNIRSGSHHHLKGRDHLESKMV